MGKKIENNVKAFAVGKIVGICFVVFVLASMNLFFWSIPILLVSPETVNELSFTGEHWAIYLAAYTYFLVGAYKSIELLGVALDEMPSLTPMLQFKVILYAPLLPWVTTKGTNIHSSLGVTRRFYVNTVLIVGVFIFAVAFFLAMIGWSSW